MTSHRPAAVIIMAAGQGTRMKSATPKVLHEIGGRSLVGHAVVTARALVPEHLVVVVGTGRELVEAHLAEIDPDVRTAVQEQQLGTGDAVRSGLTAVPDGFEGAVIVTSGDVPLLQPETLQELVAEHYRSGNAVTVLTARVPDPTGYGRIIPADDGSVAGIVEHKDATPEQRQIDEINAGIYAFDAATLRDGLSRITTDNAQGELYLTDVLAIARGDGKRVGAHGTEDAMQTEGVNDRVQLATLRAELNRRTLDQLMRDGVTVVDPNTTWVDQTVTIERDVTLLPNTQLHGATTVASGARIGPDTTLTDVQIGEDATIIRCHGSSSVIGAGASVGPFAYLRPGTSLGVAAKIGTFVETKNTSIADGAKVPHLTYAGDATIGEGANIGAGTIFANYDGVAKHRSIVGKHSFIGSNSVLVAPANIADGAYIAAGTALTEGVGPGEIAVARGKQRNIAGWVARKRAGTKTAKAAEDAQAAAQEASPGDTGDKAQREARS
ncbi:bifunctional UDP-N-acetylglucosamine pyrophosphorylase/glucosamine-1-phosphate N-acetyltransferase [Kribbella orskensis]|uniref:Bifunctional protein GlmU n=1 Tax=Kribbella orskensis TaxID=2512216 RepID=A0ABY2BDL1_9ACTN|nr:MULTISPECIES: bifunctional UDP-N-acetylglucosamine diphosphorylase/glucosamine-1-phosphate N-acetyltransferase GlmU [Kribbella]TCN35330.1 bifunctional UDP-N-acetylglucosamine pyrophosphorylase/glucosamine-1-phosphate N-acetyltransferase [Kribbella sp. VKM Ac-2500]TCO16751.1 bifunctional UDP-N-acetylglucosamine pyrophosphorylase/glucosamine-1-phosphate N-acetyltransferase [Kribbella orskensis]